MKTRVAFLIVALSVCSSAFAGPITSGGTSQIAESCVNQRDHVQLTVSYAQDGWMEAELGDYSSLNAPRVIQAFVRPTPEGYAGNGMTITVVQKNEKRNAHVVVMPSQSPKGEPAVYMNLNCVVNYR